MVAFGSWSRVCCTIRCNSVTQPKSRNFAQFEGDCWNVNTGKETVPPDAVREFLLALLDPGSEDRWLFDFAPWLRAALAAWVEYESLQPEEIFRW